MRIRVFKRSATNFRDLARARKFFHCWANDAAEAIAICDRFNDNRTSRQIRRGTKLEWERT